MYRIIPNLVHLHLQHTRHIHDNPPVLRLVIHVEKLELVLLAVKQLPLFILLPAGPGPLDAQIVAVLVDEFIPPVPHAVVGVAPVHDVVVHPVPVVRHLLPPSRRPSPS